MSFKKIVVSIFILATGQEVMVTASAGTGALVRQIGTKAIRPNVIAVAPSLMASRLGMMTGGSTPIEQIEIPKSKLIQYQDAMQEALQYARNVSKQPIEFQSPLKFPKPVVVSASPIEAKTFLDLQLVNILKNKTINSTTFRNNMIALAAMFGFYKLVDFLNNLYEDNTILMWAVEADNEDVVGYLLDLGADIHKQNSDGDTVMIIAARFGNVRIVELLINKTKEKYANDPEKAQAEVAKLLNTKNKQGRTALLDVVEYGNFLGGEQFADPTEKGRIRILKLCLDNGADLSAQDKDGNNILFLLANKMNAVANDQDSQILRELFDIFAEENPQIVQAINGKGDTLLLQSVSDNNLYLFNYLKDKIIDVMHPDEYGQNIIFKALKSNNIDMLKDVLNFIKNKWQTDSNGYVTILPSSKKPKNKKMLELLDIKDKKGNTVLDLAVMNKYPLIYIKLLVDAGANITEKDLSIAVRTQNIETVKYLLNEPVMSPTLQDLSMAFNSKNIDLFNTLVKSKKISPEIKDAFLKNGLIRSLQQPNAQMFEFLLPSANDATRHDIIKYTVQTGSPAIINTLVNSSKTTNTMRKKMLEAAVNSHASEQVIDTLLNNPLLKKVYKNDPSFCSLILREAARKLKTGDAQAVISTGSSITKKDLMDNPVLRSLIIAFKPEYEGTWGDSWIGRLLSSRIEFENKKNLFNKEIEDIISDENQNRSVIKAQDTTLAIPKKVI